MESENYKGVIDKCELQVFLDILEDRLIAVYCSLLDITDYTRDNSEDVKEIEKMVKEGRRRLKVALKMLKEFREKQELKPYIYRPLAPIWLG